MNLKPKIYSLTLGEYYVEDLRDEIKSKGLAKSLSDYINTLIRQDYEKRRGNEEKIGNLSAWLKKYPKNNSQSFVVRSNKEIMDIYANKLGR